MNSEVINTHFEVAWGRVKRITGWSKYKELAAFVDSSTESISGVKKRGKFNLDWAYKIAKEFNSSTDYIMDGEEAMKRGETGEQAVVTAVREIEQGYGLAPDLVELVRLMDRYGNKALVENVRQRLMKIKQDTEG